jgi:hypothetical protein
MVAGGSYEAREAELVAAPGLRRVAQQQQRALHAIGHGGVLWHERQSEGEAMESGEGENAGVSGGARGAQRSL